MRPSLSIRKKLILAISLPLLITYLGLLTWDYYRQRGLAVEQMQRTALERAESTAARLDARLSLVAHVTDSMADLMENPANRRDRQIQSALSSAVRMPWVTSATIILEPSDGTAPRFITRHRGLRSLLANRDTVTVDAVPTEWYARTKTMRAAGWIEPYDEHEAESKELRRVCTYVVPIFADNELAGSAAVTIDLSELHRLRSGPNGLPDRSDRLAGAHAATPTTAPAPLDDFGHAGSEEFTDFAIFDSHGMLIIASSPNAAPPPTKSIFETAAQINQPKMADAARRALGGESQVIRVTGLKQVIQSVPDDTHHWLAMSPVSVTGWMLVTAIPESVNLAPVLDRLWARAAFLAVGLVVLLLVVLAVSVGISRPIERLAAAVEQVAAGDFSAEVQHVASKDELGRLAAGFNNMTRQLRTQIAALTEQSAVREKVESELRIARQIQIDLLPTVFPDRSEFALHAMNLPALYVAGDFYDFFFTPAGLLNIVIADVSGKGVPAALVMAVTRTLVRNLAQGDHTLVEIAQATNRALLSDTASSMFVTMLLCQYEPSTGRMTYINAGHPPALRLRQGSDPTEVCMLQSPLLGVDADGAMGPFRQGEEQLAPGDTFFLYTDGVSETRGPDGKLLGTAGIARFLQPLAANTPDDICRQTSDRLEQLSSRRRDDITMVALRRSGVARV